MEEIPKQESPLENEAKQHLAHLKEVLDSVEGHINGRLSGGLDMIFGAADMHLQLLKETLEKIEDK
jgi:hypothetical protein